MPETRDDPTGFRRGVRLALDLGRVRVGVAACDRDGILAHPVDTVAATDGSWSGSDPALAALVGIVTDYEPIEVVVGLPRSLSGGEGPAAVGIREQAVRLAGALSPYGVQVRLVDERFTTTTASRQLRSAGRSAKRQRSVIDQAAAVGILEHALDLERRTGQPPGEPVLSTPS